jgi:hypothetical protein
MQRREEAKRIPAQEATRQVCEDGRIGGRTSNFGHGTSNFEARFTLEEPQETDLDKPA